MERKGRGAYAVWDVYAARARGAVRPFVQLTNLSNTSYQEILTIPISSDFRKLHRGVIKSQVHYH